MKTFRLIRWRWQNRRRAYVLRSDTYTDDTVVGVFHSRKAAEQYRDHAVPPVIDGRIDEWCVASRV